MAIKEEQYDPGYEDAYAGAYAEGGAKEDQSQVNGQCTFSSGEPSGNVQEHSQPLSETLYSGYAPPPPPKLQIPQCSCTLCKTL